MTTRPLSEIDALRLNTLPLMTPAQADTLFRQLGAIIQQLQHTLGQLDALPQLQRTALALPVARGRLENVASQNFQAADTVLTAVEQAKLERARITAAARRLLQDDTDAAMLREGALQIDAAATRIDAQLTDIMVAQSFHDLSGQTLAKVMALAIELETGLVQLLHGDALPPATVEAPAAVLHDQREVDDLLAKHGL